MSVRHPSRLYLFVLWLSLVAVLLAGCPGSSPTPPAPVQPTAPPTIEPTVPVIEEPAKPTASAPTPEPPAEEPSGEVPVADFFCEPFEAELAGAGSSTVLNQVILTGPASRFESFLTRLSTERITLEPLKSCDLGYLARGPESESTLGEATAKYQDESNQPYVKLPFSSAELAELQSRLYHIASPEDYGGYIEAIKLMWSLRDEFRIYADPNYLVGPSGGGPCSNPDIQGDPFTVGGSPFTVGGSSHTGPGATANPTIFWRQWALRRLGVKPPGVAASAGKDTVVGIFDTSPYEPPASRAEWIDLIKPPMRVHLSFPEMSTILTPISPTATAADHGLFAAGLVYAVAPGSEIRLVRVLNEYGCGDLDTLNTALHEFIYTLGNERGTYALEDVVMNLSLGVQQPPDEQLEAEGWPLEITSLQAVTEKAVERGAVIVAAAGNQTEPPDPPMPMQLPGRYPHVIGVAASNIEDQAACYTNIGDVGAPGADGRYPGEATCEPRATECSATDADCPLGVISLGRDPAGSYFYQFWAGSSFAAPLVSGQAAVLRGNTSGESPFDIMDTIYASAVQVPTTPNPFTHGLSLDP